MGVSILVGQKSRGYSWPEIVVEGMPLARDEGHPFVNLRQRNIRDCYLRNRRARFGFFWQH